MASKQEPIHIHIDASHKWFDLHLDEVWRYRELIFLFTKRTFQVSYKQTILGPLWLFINPLMTSLVYVILFGNIARLSTDGIPQILFYLTGTAIWTLFSSCLSNNASTFTSNANLFGKIYFPRLTIPLSNLFSALIRFGISMVLVALLLVYYVLNGMVFPHFKAWILLPFLLIWIAWIGMSCGILISSLTTKYRDLNVLVSFGLSLWMYASPIVYPMSQLPSGWIKTLVSINPLSGPIELFRYALLGQGSINMASLIFSLIFALVFGFLSIVVFNKVERNFIDTV